MQQVSPLARDAPTIRIADADRRRLNWRHLHRNTPRAIAMNPTSTLFAKASRTTAHRRAWLRAAVVRGAVAGMGVVGIADVILH
jgi:hypothetical protein